MEVFADSVEADVVEEGALIDVDAPLGVGGVGMHVPHLTFARERTLEKEIEFCWMISLSIIVFYSILVLKTALDWRPSSLGSFQIQTFKLYIGKALN